MARDHRRLAAIVSFDVAGYSRLMGVDDSGTLAALKAHRRELIDPKIAEHDGRIVKTTGDGLLLEFPSVVDAVRCAVDVQRGMAERNAGGPPDKRIDFRIGINVGDIIIDGDDIFGDGVNVAARLQTLAEPGGICVSRVVRDQVLDKLSFAFEDLGPQEVKNIARPVEVYRVDLGTEALQTPSRGRKRWQRLTRTRGGRWVGAGVLTLGLASIAVWAALHFWQTAPAPTAPPLSVAILPFTAQGGSAAEERLADTLTENLTSALGRSARWAHVVEYGLVVPYRGKAIDARAAGRQLNVRYLAEGTVRRAGDQIVVTARLVDTGNGTQAWSNDVKIEQSRLTQEPAALISRVTVRLREALWSAETARANKTPGRGASAVDLALHAQYVWVVLDNPPTLRGALEARKFYDEALRLDPTLGHALSGRAGTVYYELVENPHADHDRLVQEYDELSFRALFADQDNPRAWRLRAMALAFQWRWEAALDANSAARNIDPTSWAAIVERGELMVYMGRPSEALAVVEQALALESADPISVQFAMYTRCRADMALGRYDEAIAACEKSTALYDWWLPHFYLVAAYTHQGETAKGAVEMAKLLKQRPTASIADYKALKLSNVPAFWQQTEEHVFADLRKAGIPEK